jgi:5,10-methylenetetrahydromethanopterin reductase
VTVERPDVGLVLGSDTPPTSIPGLAAAAERLGFGELWIPEDCFFNGGIATAATALAVTERIHVGLGVVAGLGRHPAVLAMEVATLAGVHPGRLTAGIGLGAPAWVAQMGLTPKSQLGAMRETVTSFKRLMAGEELTVAGEVHAFDRVALTHAPLESPPVHMGVLGPRMLRLSGEIADGTIVSVMGTPAYVSWLRERVAEGQALAGREGAPHRITTFALYRVDEDAKQAKRAVADVLAFYLFVAPRSALTDVYGIRDDLLSMHERGGARALELIRRELPAQWIDDLTISGSPDECAAKIEQLLHAGSDVVCLWPAPSDGVAEMLELTARRVLPRVGASSAPVPARVPEPSALPRPRPPAA